MADYNITQPSNEYLPGENLSWFSADSIDAGEKSFTYRMRLQITDVDGTFTTGSTGDDVVGTFRIPPRPVTANAYFSPNAVAKNYVTSGLQFNFGGAVGTTGAGLRKYQITFGQEYIDSGGTIVEQDNVVSDTFYIWDSIIQDVDFPSYTEDDYLIVDSATTEEVNLLTDGPNEGRCVIENDNQYAIINHGSTFNSTDRNLSVLIDPYDDFSVGGTFDEWSQYYPPSQPGFPWEEVAGGIQVSSTVSGSLYSGVMYLMQSDTNPRGTGPVWEDDVIEVTLNTTDSVGFPSPPMYLWGKPGSGDWEIVKLMDTFDNGGTLGFETSFTLVGASYSQIGFGIQGDGGKPSPTVSTIDVWTYGSPDGLYWYRDKHSGVPSRYPITSNNKITWLNAGTDGVGTDFQQVPFSIYIANGADVRLSESIGYTYCGECNSCDIKSITWLNSLGGYDSYEFNCLSGKELDVERVIGERTLPPGYTVGQRGRLNSSNVAAQVRTVATKYTQGADIDWLESLFMSTDVYEVQPDRSFIPIVINNGSYKQFVKQNKLMLVEFSYTLGYNRKAQIN